MANRYLKATGIGVAMLITTLSFGQGKQQPVPNFVNPFSKKAQQDSITPIAPNHNNGRVAYSQDKPKIEKINGSFRANLKNERLSKTAVSNDFNSLMNLNEQHTFQQISEKTDELGIVHTNFQQLYKGYAVEGNILLLHSKNGSVNSLNGQVAEFTNVETKINITTEIAKTIAKDYLKVTQTINDYPVETVITRVPNEKGIETRLAHKVRVDSYSPFTMCYVYVDAQTGNVLNKVNLIAHADVPGTGQTMYSGNQAITVDSHSGSFRLRESGRKIETYNGDYSSPKCTTYSRVKCTSDSGAKCTTLSK